MRAIGLVILLLATSGQAQILHFFQDPGMSETWHRCVESEIGYCVDSLVIDTVYMENGSTAELEMQIQRYPMARYEYYTDGALYRRIDIRQMEHSYPSIEDIRVGEVVQVYRSEYDIPNGAYHEFFPNGNIRIKGTLAGYNDDGTLKKTGEWTEWDKDENVIRKESYP